MVLLFVVVPAVAVAQSTNATPLTEEEAVRRALARPEVAALTEGEIGAARGAEVEAGLWQNPQVGWSREQTFRSPGASTEDYLSLSQAFDVSGGRSLRVEAGGRRVRAAASEAEARSLDLAAEVRHRFYTVIYCQDRVRAAEAWVRRVGELTATLDRRASAGDVARYDVKRLERERATAEARLRAEQASLESARQRLCAITGPSTDAPVTVVTGALLPETAPLEAADLETRLASRPDLRALVEEAEAAQTEARAARRAWIPEVTVSGGLKTAEAAGDRATGFLAGVSLPLPVFHRKQGEAAAAEARSRAALARRDLALAERSGDVHALAREAAALSEAARQLRREALDTSLEVTRTAEAAYQAGEVGVLELLDAHRGVYESATQVLDLEAGARRAQIDLDRLTGGAR
jgi:cobalt-zinc-cadmium efflux system outer membrane protein